MKSRGNIECACCGKTISKMGPTQRVCKSMCAPKEGFRHKCVRCGKPKQYNDFWDYRYSVNGDGKLWTCCKDCKRAEARDRARKNKLKKQT